MGRVIALLTVAAGLCMGVTCTITGPGGGTIPGFGSPPLDQTNATIEIDQVAGGASADISAWITDNIGLGVTLDPDQAVLVNDTALAGPNYGGQYAATVPAVALYTVTVREPTRGVQTTEIGAPLFDITAPAADAPASLSGFAVTWSAADSSLQVIVELSQTHAGAKKTQTFGPFADGGGRTFTATELRSFIQGEKLTITVTKTNTVASIAGFRSGTLTTRVQTIRQVVPAP